MPEPTDNEDFGDLYEKFFSKVYSYVSYRDGSVQETEDIVSQVFLRAAEAFPRFEWRHQRSFHAWIFRIAHNALSDFYRMGNSQRTALALEDFPETASDHASVEEKLLMKERFVLLRELIGSLSPRAAEVITLRFFGELSNQEIAEVLDIQPRTVSSYLARGLRDLEEKVLRHQEVQMWEEPKHGD